VTEKELAIIKEITEYLQRAYNHEKIDELLEEYIKSSFGTSTNEFRNNASLKYYVDEQGCTNRASTFRLWFSIERFFTTNFSASEESAQLALIEQQILEVFAWENGTKDSGTQILPLQIANPTFIKNVYLSNNEKLITLFKKYLPEPRAHIFSGFTVPLTVMEKEKQTTTVIKRFLATHKRKESPVEDVVLKVQRSFRATKRRKEEDHRLHKRWPEQNSSILQREANEPYRPKCEDKALSDRLMIAADKVKLFSTVRHLTSTTAIESIFNDCLYGRRTLLQFYLPFRPAALHWGDQEEGDGNAICLGANVIDQRSTQGLELLFDLDKISKDNPCVFYKQRDFGLELIKTREVESPNFKFYFSHTENYGKPDGYSSMEVRANGNTPNPNSWVKNLQPIASAQIMNSLLLSYNIPKMHQILTLNFFRFIDVLDSKNKAKEIYANLNQLDNDELVNVLQQIGINMTDTMEFNFYGAHKINFSSLLKIQQGFYI